MARVGEALDLALVRDAPAGAMRGVHAFVDRGLSRSRADWGDLKLPAALRAQVDEVWSVVSALADAGDPRPLAAVANDGAPRRYRHSVPPAWRGRIARANLNTGH